MRSITKSRNIYGYKRIFKEQSINLITTDKPSPIPRPAFKIYKYIAKLSKRELKDFIYFKNINVDIQYNGKQSY